jgi:hypothetical protein
MASLRWLTSDAIVGGTASPHREVHHATPKPESKNPTWLAYFRFDAHFGLTSDIA